LSSTASRVKLIRGLSGSTKADDGANSLTRFHRPLCSKEHVDIPSAYDSCPLQALISMGVPTGTSFQSSSILRS